MANTNTVFIPSRNLTGAIRAEVSAFSNTSARWFAVATEVAARLVTDEATKTAGLAAFRAKAKATRQAEVAAADLPADEAKRLDARLRKAISRAAKGIALILDNGGELPVSEDGTPAATLNALEVCFTASGDPADKARKEGETKAKTRTEMITELAEAIRRARTAKRKAELADELANVILRDGK